MDLEVKNNGKSDEDKLFIFLSGSRSWKTVDAGKKFREEEC